MNLIGTQLNELPDLAVAQLAATQEAMISSAQMRELGLSARAVHVRARRGVLHRVHRGVYVVGVPRMTPRARLWAGVLACGGPDVAAISHVTAAVEWRMLLRWPCRVDVTTLGANHATRGLRVHRSLTLDAQRDVTRHHGLPITTPARTIVDISSRLPMHSLQRACHEATFLNLLDPDDINDRLDAGPAGAAKLRTVLTRLANTGPHRTKSGLEDAFLAIVERFDIPTPLVNAPLLGYTVDFLWPAQKLVVETDGRNHLRPIVYEADRQRDAILQLHGFRVVRFTSPQLDERPRWVAEATRRLLSER